MQKIKARIIKKVILLLSIMRRDSFFWYKKLLVWFAIIVCLGLFISLAHTPSDKTDLLRLIRHLNRSSISNLTSSLVHSSVPFCYMHENLMWTSHIPRAFFVMRKRSVLSNRPLETCSAPLLEHLRPYVQFLVDHYQSSISGPA